MCYRLGTHQNEVVLSKDTAFSEWSENQVTRLCSSFSFHCTKHTWTPKSVLLITWQGHLHDLVQCDQQKQRLGGVATLTMKQRALRAHQCLCVLCSPWLIQCWLVAVVRHRFILQRFNMNLSLSLNLVLSTCWLLTSGKGLRRETSERSEVKQPLIWTVQHRLSVVSSSVAADNILVSEEK